MNPLTYDFTNMLNKIDLARADLNLLVLVETVFEESHVGRAAVRLNIAVSRQPRPWPAAATAERPAVPEDAEDCRVPTTRATDLAAAVADVLVRARNVIATAAPFFSATSTRCFRIGAPDSISAMFIPQLLAVLGRDAPGAQIGIRQLLPSPGEGPPGQPWRTTFAELDAQLMDIAIIPSDDIPARFHQRTVFVEDFVLAMRKGHSAARKLTLALLCARGTWWYRWRVIPLVSSTASSAPADCPAGWR